MTDSWIHRKGANPDAVSPVGESTRSLPSANPVLSLGVSLDRLRAAQQGPQGLARARGRWLGLPPQPQSWDRLGHQAEPHSI